MSRTLPSYTALHRRRVRPGGVRETFISLNPATGLPIYEAADGSREDVDRAVRAAHSAFRQRILAGPDSHGRGRFSTGWATSSVSTPRS